MEADALLAHHDRPDIGIGRRLDDRVDRVADQEIDPFALQNLGNGGGEARGRIPGRGSRAGGLPETKSVVASCVLLSQSADCR
jgi:hypothetical protein